MVICPGCAAAIAPGEGGYRCAACAVTYRADGGVVSFLAPDAEVAGFQARFVDLLRGDDIDRRHFWFRARNDLVLQLCRRFCAPGGRLLEIGCGTGVVLGHLVAHGVAAEGLDALPAAAAASRSRSDARIWLADARRLPFAAEFDAIGMFDCLEHIEQHDLVVAEARRALRPGGRLLVTVPAGPRLWSGLDEAMGHVRRYTRTELRSVLQRNGFQVALLTHYNATLLPLYWLHRRLLARPRTGRVDASLVERAVRVPVAPVNEILYRIMRAESWLLSRVALPWGASLAAVATRA
jgi:SAM-dependent methyltransferase